MRIDVIISFFSQSRLFFCRFANAVLIRMNTRLVMEWVADFINYMVRKNHIVGMLLMNFKMTFISFYISNLS
jgi:hypothetical protein